MGDDIDLLLLLPSLREGTKALVDACMDASLLDLINKLLMSVCGGV